MKVRSKRKTRTRARKNKEKSRTDMQQRVAEARIGAELVIGAELKSNTRNYALYRFFLFFSIWIRFRILIQVT
jgi:hypothetical protein